MAQKRYFFVPNAATYIVAAFHFHPFWSMLVGFIFRMLFYGVLSLGAKSYRNFTMKKTILIALLTLVGYALSAQWTNNTDLNTLVAASRTGDMQSIGTSDGKTYVAFWHEVPEPIYYELRLQLLDEQGNQLFGPEGILVNDTVSMSSFTTVWSLSIDRDDNILIGFNGTGNDNAAYVHKIAPDGTQFWGTSGVAVGSGYDVKTVTLANGEVLVTWLPGNKGAMQKIAADGSLVWPNPITIEPTIANHKTSGGELAALSGGDYIVIVHDRGGFSPSALPYAQRYNTDGVAVWPGLVALTNNYYTAFNRRYSLIQDGDVVYFGYSGAQGIQPHGFLQRINPDGTLPWGINGSDFSTQTTFFERDVQVAFEAGSDVIWGICEYSDNTQGQVGEYVQKFDKQTGSRQLSNEGREVFPVSTDYISHQGKLRTIDDLPIFLVSDGNSNGVFPKDLLAVYLDKNGAFAWPEHTRPMATNANGVKSRIQFNKPAFGKATCVWVEARGNEFGVPYAQQLALACTPPTAGFSFSANALEVSFGSTAQAATSVFWSFGDDKYGSGINPTHTYSSTGTYTVCQYASNDCGTDTLCSNIFVIMSPVSVAEKVDKVVVSPNPNEGKWSVTLEVSATSDCSYGLYTSTGQLVSARALGLVNGLHQISMDESLQTGTYFMLLDIGKRRSVYPIIVR